MTTQEYLRRHFARMGARVVVRGPAQRQGMKIAIDVGKDRSGELFDIRCVEDAAFEVLDVQPRSRHMVLMTRDGGEKHKYLLGRDERHWFAAAVPGEGVRDVRTAIENLRPKEIEGRAAIRQGEWFFVADRGVDDKDAVIHYNEPLSRGAGSKPHICEQVMRRGGESVMVSTRYPSGVSLEYYQYLIASDRRSAKMRWIAMTLNAEVYARGEVRHRDHKTIDLNGWHRVYMNRERFAKHAVGIVFLD